MPKRRHADIRVQVAETHIAYLAPFGMHEIAYEARIGSKLQDPHL